MIIVFTVDVCCEICECLHPVFKEDYFSLSRFSMSWFSPGNSFRQKLDHAHVFFPFESALPQRLWCSGGSTKKNYTFSQVWEMFSLASTAFLTKGELSSTIRWWLTPLRCHNSRKQMLNKQSWDKYCLIDSVTILLTILNVKLRIFPNQLSFPTHRFWGLSC